MNKNIVRTLSVFVIAFTSLFLINIGDVKAAGYAYCTYTWSQSNSASSTGYTGEGVNTSYTYEYKVGFVAYKSGSDITVKTNIACWAEGSCSIKNDNALVNGVKNYYKSNSWEDCPDVYIDHDGLGQGDLHVVNLSTAGSGDFNIKGQLDQKGGSSNGSYKTGLKALEELKSAAGSTSTTYVGPGVAPPGTDNATTNNASNIKTEDIKGAVKDPKEATEGKTGTCDLIPDSIREFLGHLFFIIQIIGIILMLILTFVEFVKVITASEDGGIKTAFKNSIKRIVAVVVLLLLPTLILWIIDMVNDSYGNSHTVIGANGDPICIKDKIKGN